MASPSKSRTNNLGNSIYQNLHGKDWDGVRGSIRTINWPNERYFIQFIGRSQLTYNELEEILLDVKINLNNR